MPKNSRSRNTRKRCRCAKWRHCDHPWYIDYGFGTLRYRPNLDVLTGKHPPNFRAAQVAAKAQIVSWLDGKMRPYLLAKQAVLSGRKRYL